MSEAKSSGMKLRLDSHNGQSIRRTMAMNGHGSSQLRPDSQSSPAATAPEPDCAEPASEEEFVTELTANQPAIRAFIICLMPGDPGTDDVLQQTNITLWRKRRQYRSGSNFRAWAFECAKWTMRAYLKEQRRKSWLIVDDELTRSITERLSERMPAGASDAQTALALCLGRLREADRDLLLSYYEDGKSLAECAARCGRSAGSLKVTLFRLRAALRRCVTGRLAATAARG